MAEKRKASQPPKIPYFPKKSKESNEVTIASKFVGEQMGVYFTENILFQQ